MDLGFQDSPSTPSSFQKFKFAQFQFILKVINPLNLPEYKGSTLRGGFGYSFKKVVCALRTKECRNCLLKEKCIYSYVFETPPPSGTRLMRKYPAAPHPFVLLPPLEEDRIYEPGEILQFHLTLIGRAIDYLPYFIYTFEELGKMGLGKGKGQYSLEEVRAIGPDETTEKIYSRGEKLLRSPTLSPLTFDLSPYSSPSSLHLLFLTPTRLKFQGELTSDLKFHIFFRNLLRRISLLSYFHCGEELKVDYKGLVSEAERIETIENHLHWHDWERYSTRQETKMKLGGFLGRISFSGNLNPFRPYLLLGEFIHVGKGSSFGLGKYEILNKD